MRRPVEFVTTTTPGRYEPPARSGFSRRPSPRKRDVIILAAGAVSLAVLALTPGIVGPLAVVALLTGGVSGAFTLVQASAVSDRWGTPESRP
ncbi:hypothetical protein [Kribbella solani]|uniref:MFS transporter n=1 Tax=Kribbella solani TaxID=236067 RepID=A0A841DTU4_9ACTN|nr:hypothetical protein [Kribbella solani]MBB5980305.1 hypothetical protein [Kribbella solani]